MREATSQSHEGVQVTLSKMGDIVTMITQLGMQAQPRMTNEVVAQEQVSDPVF